MKILCAGEALVDMIGDKKTLQKSENFAKRPGGAPANVAVAASRMKANVSMAATVGEDQFGELMIQKLKEENIKTENILKIPEKTTLAFVALNENAEPEFNFYRQADRKIRKEQLNKNNYDIAHFGSLPFTNKKTAQNLTEFAKETNAKISFDPNLRKELLTDQYIDRLQKFIEHADIIFLSDEEESKLNLQPVEEVIISRGSQGAKIKGEDISKKPPEVEKVVDTTGAGDALTGTYLAHRNQGKEKALKKAVKASAESIKKKGAMTALPKKKDL